MPRPEKHYARTSYTPRVIPLAMVAGETLKLEVDWSQMLGEYGTTISTSCFESDGSGLGVSGAAVVGNVTSVNVASSNSGGGGGVVENCVTLVDGRVLSRSWYVRVTDPVAMPLGDYAG